MSKKKFSYISSRLTAEQELLLKQEKELRQKETLLKRRLQKLPTMMGKRVYEEERNTHVIHTSFAATHQLPKNFSQPKERATYRGLPMREKRAAKIKFFALVMILLALLILIWRSLPA